MDLWGTFGLITHTQPGSTPWKQRPDHRFNGRSWWPKVMVQGKSYYWISPLNVRS